jgi:hypothetical protein
LAMKTVSFNSSVSTVISYDHDDAVQHGCSFLYSSCGPELPFGKRAIRETSDDKLSCTFSNRNHNLSPIIKSTTNVLFILH